MANTSFDIFKPEVLTQNLLSLNSVVKKHLQDGVSFVKDELLDMYDKAGSCITKMVLPVNNFLKDLTQIESELSLEHVKECIGNGIHIGYMEENY